MGRRGDKHPNEATKTNKVGSKCGRALIFLLRNYVRRLPNRILTRLRGTAGHLGLKGSTSVSTVWFERGCLCLQTRGWGGAKLFAIIREAHTSLINSLFIAGYVNCLSSQLVRQTLSGFSSGRLRFLINHFVRLELGLNTIKVQIVEKNSNWYWHRWIKFSSESKS